jgi:hypothetical protein
MPLLPIQRAFFVTDSSACNHHTQAVLLTAPAGLDLSSLHRVVEALYRRQ